MLTSLVVALSLTSLTSLAVPYLPQTDALCGGAAAAMVFRYWGDVHADIEQFAPLVDRHAGGIADDVLVRAIEERGWLAHIVPGSIDQLNEQIESGQGGFVSSALFNYPTLMAADVLAYRATTVPVGDDQRQHVELMRESARRFNERFGETLVVPEERIPELGARIMDLQVPTNKMSTTGGSEQGTVLVLDDAKTVTKKIKSAVTDSGREVVRGEGKQGIENLIDILAVVRGSDADSIEAEFQGQGYGDFKGAVAEAVVEYLAPVRERYEAIRADEAAIESALAAGAEKARAIAAVTLADVREAMGVAEPRS